jgi:hypothetical protein
MHISRDNFREQAVPGCRFRPGGGAARVPGVVYPLAAAVYASPYTMVIVEGYSHSNLRFTSLNFPVGLSFLGV